MCQIEITGYEKKDLSYSRSSNLRIDTGRVKKKAKMYKSKTNKEKKKKQQQGHFFFAFIFYQTRSG